jgi:shikimate kinase
MHSAKQAETKNTTLKMKIFLIGMMGSGKSFWTDKLARKLRLPKYDLDSLIQNVEDRSIQQIFDESGEEHFRKMETIVLKWFADRDEYILATGGGTPCFNDNMQWMNQEGLTIWLDETVQALLKRLIPEKSHRPLISKLSDKQLERYLAEKKEERRSFYSQAQFTLSGNDINEENLLSLIKENTNA